MLATIELSFNITCFGVYNDNVVSAFVFGIIFTIYLNACLNIFTGAFRPAFIITCHTSDINRQYVYFL